MRKGFTLLELLVVIIIISVLATLGYTQYGRVIERARGAEARGVLGTVRLLAMAYRYENDTLSGFSDANAGIGSSLDQAPSGCRSSHFFRYSVSAVEPIVTITATRCASDGKNPPGGAAAGTTLTLTSNLNTGTDSWGGNGGY